MCVCMSLWGGLFIEREMIEENPYNSNTMTEKTRLAMMICTVQVDLLHLECQKIRSKVF